MGTSSDDSQARAIRRYVTEHQGQLLEVLAKWDDGDECLSPKEFRQAWRVLELDAGLGSVPRATLDALYVELDADGTENIPWDDVSHALKRMADELLHGGEDDEVSFEEKPLRLPPLTPRRSGSTAHEPDVDDEALHDDEDDDEGGHDYQPPRHANLRYRGGDGGGGSSSRPSPRRARAPMDARSAVSGATHRTRISAVSGVTGCSTATGMSQAERREYRQRREVELARQFDRPILRASTSPRAGATSRRAATRALQCCASRRARAVRSAVGATGRRWARGSATASSSTSCPRAMARPST